MNELFDLIILGDFDIGVRDFQVSFSPSPFFSHDVFEPCDVKGSLSNAFGEAFVARDDCCWICVGRVLQGHRLQLDMEIWSNEEHGGQSAFARDAAHSVSHGVKFGPAEDVCAPPGQDHRRCGRYGYPLSRSGG